MPNFTTNQKYPVVESWFFAALPKSNIVNAWLAEFMRVNDYDSTNDYIESIQRERKIDLQNIASPEYLTIHASMQVVLQTKRNNPYNIVLLDCNDGPFKYLADNVWNSKKAIDALCQ